ncbi:MAG: hypothetical protein RDV48_09040 [Candidatus Eremiobacteraeota bacterium]|nr:hypothetical protein [Candidatus Eremiobacteraeota bacterium]
MDRDPRDRIDQIRAQRGRDTVQVGINPMEASLVAPIAAPSLTPDSNILGVDFKSPWLRDRVSLSLEAQIAMMEMRANYRLTLADLGYTNRISILPVRPGIFIKIEPTGCYRMVYHNR